VPQQPLQLPLAYAPDFLLHDTGAQHQHKRLLQLHAWTLLVQQWQRPHGLPELAPLLAGPMQIRNVCPLIFGV